MSGKTETKPEKDEYLEGLRSKAVVPSDPEGETWEPRTKGDEVYGMVVDIKIVDTKSNGPKPLMIVTTPNGNAAVWLGGICLTRWMRDANPSIGDYVYIRFEGAIKLANGRTMNQFACAIEEGEGPRANLSASRLPANGTRVEEFDPFA